MRRFPPQKIYKLYNNLFSKSASLADSWLVQRWVERFNKTSDHLVTVKPSLSLFQSSQNQYGTIYDWQIFTLFINDRDQQFKVFVSLYYVPFLISLSSFPVVFVEGPHFCSKDCVGSWSKWIHSKTIKETACSHMTSLEAQMFDWYFSSDKKSCKTNTLSSERWSALVNPLFSLILITLFWLVVRFPAKHLSQLNDCLK